MAWQRQSGTSKRAQKRLRDKFGMIHVSKPLVPDPEMPGGFRVERKQAGYTYPEDTYRGPQPRSSGKVFP